MLFTSYFFLKHYRTTLANSLTHIYVARGLVQVPYTYHLPVIGVHLWTRVQRLLTIFDPLLDYLTCYIKVTCILSKSFLMCSNIGYSQEPR